jgi:hypothetical protein
VASCAGVHRPGANTVSSALGPLTSIRWAPRPARGAGPGPRIFPRSPRFFQESTVPARLKPTDDHAAGEEQDRPVQPHASACPRKLGDHHLAQKTRKRRQAAMAIAPRKNSPDQVACAIAARRPAVASVRPRACDLSAAETSAALISVLCSAYKAPPSVPHVEEATARSRIPSTNHGEARHRKASGWPEPRRPTSSVRAPRANQARNRERRSRLRPENKCVDPDDRIGPDLRETAKSAAAGAGAAHRRSAATSAAAPAPPWWRTRQAAAAPPSAAAPRRPGATFLTLHREVRPC